MIALSPLMVKQEKLSDGSIHHYTVYLFDEYAALMRKLERPPDDVWALMNEEERTRKDAWIKEKKKSLFGPDVKIISPDRYQEIGMIRELGLQATWHRINIHRQADYIAEYRLKQMADVVFRWYEDEQREKDAKKSKKGNTNGAAQQNSAGMG